MNSDIILSPITIIGSGPAGAMTSLFLSKYKIPHILLDKAFFPRDKVCGDGLSGKVVSVLKKLDPLIIEELKNDTSKNTGSWGVMFVAPNGKKLDIPFKKDMSKEPHPAGFVSKRIDFDFFLAQKTNSLYANRIYGAEATRLVIDKNKDEIQVFFQKDNQTIQINSKIVIGAEGERSITEKTFFQYPLESDHFYAGIRAYYNGVSDMHPQNFIELHFIHHLLPGYFWIFPLPGGKANVGICMLSSAVSKNKINLREKLNNIIHEDPNISLRFKNATLDSKISGWGLPLGSKKRAMTKDHVILTGDAASLIDPFTGEGIGNALYSGMIAAKCAEKALSENNYTEAFLKTNYDEQIELALRDELKLSHTMQKLCKKPWLFNFVASRSEKNQTLRETISCMFEDLDMRAKLRDPKYYLKLLFNY